MDPLSGTDVRADDGAGQSRPVISGFPGFIAAALFIVTVGHAAEPDPISIDVFQRPAIQADLAGLEQLIAAGPSGAAERAIRQRLKRFGSIPEYHLLLAAVLASNGHADAALKSLEMAVELGFSGDVRRFSEQFSALAEHPSYKNLVARIRTRRAERLHSMPQVNPAVVGQQTAMVAGSNTFWDFEEKSLRAAFRFSDAGPGHGVLPSGPTQSAKAPILNRRYLSGRAAGNYGDLYDNRDRDHSTLKRARFPQLTFVEYDKEAQKARIDYGLNPGLQFNAITVGNSSSAVTGGPFWRSQPRLALTSRGGPERLFSQYMGNHLYIYPEHRDHDPDQGDLFPANTPYVLISQGSSGSDKALLAAAVTILAAFKPAVKDYLRQNRLVMPTLQMVFRWSLKSVSGDREYLSSQAHPTVFRGEDIDLDAMIERAGSLDIGEIPPMVRLVVKDETKTLPGIHVFGGGTMRLFDTPSAIARVGRSTSHQHRMRISAEGTLDPNGRDLKFHWVVLRGDKARIGIKPLDERASVVDLTVPWHDLEPVPGSELMSNRVDIGVFAYNGAHYSAPAFVSFTFPANEWREYDAAGRIRFVDYNRPELRGRYTDPLLFPQRDWSDRYHYDESGRLTGWTRSRHAGSAEYTRHGARVVEADELGRPLRAALVRYVLKSGRGNAPKIGETLSGQVLQYAYTSEDDFYGSLAVAE